MKGDMLPHMATDTYRTWILENRPTGTPTRENFELVKRPIPDPKTDEVVVQTQYMSVDPYMRGRMRDSQAHTETWPVGEPMRARVVGDVVASENDEFSVGDTVIGKLEWGEYTVAKGSNLERIEYDDIPISTALHVLGSPGRTAFVGLVEVGHVKPGDTVIVSAAGGAVGSIAGQIARLSGCRVVGITGGEEKAVWLTDELDFDAAINYRATDDLSEAIGTSCPDGVDLYFENVGGEISDAVFAHLNHFSRVPVCGKISLYNQDEDSAESILTTAGTAQATGPRRMEQRTRTRTEGFIVSDYEHLYEYAENRLRRWVREGEISYRETITNGIEQAPDAFLGLFDGENIGKQLVKMGTDA